MHSQTNDKEGKRKVSIHLKRVAGRRESSRINAPPWPLIRHLAQSSSARGETQRCASKSLHTSNFKKSEMKNGTLEIIPSQCRKTLV